MRNGVLQSIFSLPASEDRHFLYISQYRFSRGKNFHINRKLELWHSLAAEVRLVGARLMCGVRTEQWSLLVQYDSRSVPGSRDLRIAIGMTLHFINGFRLHIEAPHNLHSSSTIASAIKERMKWTYIYMPMKSVRNE
jgi:hypothetical protein